ncbi:Xyloglucan endotransglucosylase/hydrolase 2 [Glycine max]|nr:Xyloglucan endotransglucosylase/hydrolase 2 [Glycine max]
MGREVVSCVAVLPVHSSPTAFPFFLLRCWNFAIWINGFRHLHCEWFVHSRMEKGVASAIWWIRSTMLQVWGKSTEKQCPIVMSLKRWERKECKPNSLPILHKMQEMRFKSYLDEKGVKLGRLLKSSSMTTTKHVKSREEGEPGQIIKLSSQGPTHDEIHFEFLRNLSGDPYILRTNIFTQGKGNREQQFYLWFNPTRNFHTYSIISKPQHIMMQTYVLENIKIKKHGSTEDFLSLPYICTLLNCSLWTYYGIIKAREYLVATVNGFGIVVETIYVILFLIYAPKGIRGRTAILAVILDVAISAEAVATTQLALQGEARGGAVGVMGAGLNIVIYFSPLCHVSMGTNQTGKRFYQVKVKSPDTTSIKELGRLMEPLQTQAFRKTYGKILELTIAEVSIEAIASLTRYYDQPLRCFTFGDFQLVPTIEEFEEILGCPLGGRKPYLSSGCLPSLSRIATVVKDSARGLDRIKQTRNGIAGLPQKYLEDKARGMANQGDWVPFMDVLALLIFGVVLFPNVDGLIDLAAIDAFLAYHHSKESPVVAVLADLFDTFDRRKDQELRGIRNGIIGGYHEWLKVRIRGLDWLAKLKVVSEENFEAPEEDEERARKEEYGRNKFRGALWGSNNELKLRREERDQSRAHSMVLKEELIVCSRSKRSLSQRLCETETNMLAIIAKYQEELGLATAHEHRIADEYAQVYAEKEARGRVIDSLRQEATMWMDRFALTLNGSQELPRLLAKAKAMADTYSAPEEIHGLLGYCQHMIDLMAHIIRNQETQEQMKADMSALKEQMASMMEAMLGMKQLMEKNAATAAAVSSAAEADPTLLATTHHPPSNIVGRGRDTLGHDGSPHLGYNRAAYPYGLPPNYSPPILQEDAGHIASPVHEKEPPQQPDEVHKDPQDYARRDVEFYPPIPEGPAPGTLPQPNIAASPILVGYMPSSFADLVFAGERIEVGLKRGNFDYVSSTNNRGNRGKRKEGDAHAVSSTPAWVKPQQTPHGTHQYAQHHPSFSAHAGNASSSTPVQPKAPTQREAPQVPTPNTTRPAGNSNTTRNFPPRPLPEFTPLPMTYEDLLPSLIANHLAVVTPGRVLEPPFPKWYDPNATCKYHGGVPGHSVEKCLALKYKVQHLMDAGWLTFQEDRPNVRTNPLANHGGGAVNAVESDRPHRSKPLRDVATPRRFIFEALQKGGVIPHSGCKEDSCLLHSGEMHDMETCLEVEELLQRMIDQGRLEVGIEGKEEQHICMQSTEGSGVAKPEPLVIYFTKSAASQKPGHPLMAKPVPFPYQNSHAVPWRYTPPGKKEGEVTDVSSLSAKVTNITGLSGVTHSGRKDNGGITSLIKTQGNRGKYGLGYKPTQADMKRSIAGRKNSGQNSRWRQESEGSPPCHISRSFISAGLGDEGQVFAICGDDVPSTLDLVRPCPPDFQLGNWRVEERPGIYATSIMLCDLSSSVPGMAPRKLASKRSRKDKAAEGTSSAPEYDSHRFRSVVNQQRFEAIKGWSFLRERRVQLREDEYTDFQEEIGRRRWTPLVTPMAKFDPEIRQAQGDAPQAAGAPPPPHQAGQAGAFDIEQYLRHLVRQQAANHRAHVRTHDCLYQMSLSMQSQGFASFSCPTPDQFRAEVAWPGDWPEAQAGEAPPEAPGDGEEAHEDEEMADLLDFLGESGDT